MTSQIGSRITKSKQPLTAVERNERRHLILQDALALLILTVVSVAIGVLTYFFFHSFSQHRTVLEKRWFARGERALAAHNPQAAVDDFRSALSLSAANLSYQLALAQALAQANRNEEAYAYFSSLHEARPGDGFLNLQLARLAVKRDEPARAIVYYRAALTGLWYGEGASQRFQIRLELAKYLMSLGRNTDAQGDLLTAEGNSLDHPTELYQVANLLELAGDPSDALIAYRRVEGHTGASAEQVLNSLQAEARVAVAMGQYKRAAMALNRYRVRARQHPAAGTPQQRQASQQKLAQLQRLLQLIPFDSLAPRERARRVLQQAAVAQQRYASCSTTVQSQSVSAGDSSALAALDKQWAQFSPVNARKLMDDPSLQQGVLTWVGQVEILTAKLCGPPTGDDALLLQLARNPDKS